VEHLRAEGTRNLADLRDIQRFIAPHKRSLVPILDILLWAAHPASGLAPTLNGWEHRFVPIGGDASRQPAVPSADVRPGLGCLRPEEQRRERDGSPVTRAGRSFDDIWNCIRARGGMRVVSSRGTEYRATADVSKGRKVL